MVFEFIIFFILDFGLLHCKVKSWSLNFQRAVFHIPIKDVITNIFRNTDINFEECSKFTSRYLTLDDI